MTKIAVIAGSNRKAAESVRIGAIVVERLKAAGVETDFMPLNEIVLPLWDESKWDPERPADSPWSTIWPAVSARLKAADGFVVLSPEWHGMSSPALKNFFCCCDGGELAFKPAYLIAVSAGAGGAYPISELRMSSYKNNYLHWLPDHLIVRHAATFKPGDPDFTEGWLADRMDHGLKILAAYADAARPIREEIVDLKILRNGM